MIQASHTPTITRREWMYVLVYTALLLLIVSLPYTLAWARHDGFSGFLFGVDDGNSYLGKMRLGAMGRWDFSLFYTAEAHEGAGLLFLPYILPGQIVGHWIPETDPTLAGALLGTFHLMRIVFGVLLLLVMYRFIAAFVEDAGWRLFALVLATIGGGFGWLLLVTGSSSPPPEFFIPEGFTLQILLGLPHLALARAALLGGLLLLMRGLDSAHWVRWSVLAGLCWLIVGLAVPFYLVIIYCILGAWGLAAWARTRQFPIQLFWRAVVGAGITLPLFLYNTLLFMGNPAFAQWSAQNILASPPPLHYLLAYLPLGALAFIGGRRLWRQANVPQTLLIGWPLIVSLLVYLPINVQRRLAEAVIVPLAILTVIGLDVLARRFSRRTLVIVTLAAAMPPSLILLLGGYITALAGPPQVVYPPAEIVAFNWLNNHAQTGEVVLGAFETGNRIPAYTHLRVYVGHGPETLNAMFKKAEVTRYYNGEMTADERAALYDSMGIRYVFYGADERALAGDASPDWQAGLTRIYAEEGYEIYEVP